MLTHKSILHTSRRAPLEASISVCESRYCELPDIQHSGVYKGLSREADEDAAHLHKHGSSFSQLVRALSHIQQENMEKKET